MRRWEVLNKQSRKRNKVSRIRHEVEIIIYNSMQFETSRRGEAKETWILKGESLDQIERKLDHCKYERLKPRGKNWCEIDWVQEVEEEVLISRWMDEEKADSWGDVMSELPKQVLLDSFALTFFFLYSSVFQAWVAATLMLAFIPFPTGWPFAPFPIPGGVERPSLMCWRSLSISGGAFGMT